MLLPKNIYKSGEMNLSILKSTFNEVMKKHLILNFH